MKHSILSITILTLCAIFTISCEKQREPLEIEKIAMEKMDRYFSNVFPDMSNLSKLSNANTVYVDSTLCIIHADASMNDGNVEKVEYVLIREKKWNRTYEVGQFLNGDNKAVFASREEWEKQKWGHLYEILTYESGMKFLSALLMIDGKHRSNGEQVKGDTVKTTDISVPVKINKNWILRVQSDGNYLTCDGSMNGRSAVLGIFKDMGFAFHGEGFVTEKKEDWVHPYICVVESEKGEEVKGLMLGGYVGTTIDLRATGPSEYNQNGVPELLSVAQKITFTILGYGDNVMHFDVAGFDEAKPFLNY